MKAKSLLIPVAAFAVTATGVSAFNSEVLERANLTEEQKSAFEEAHELRKEGDKEAAKEVLLDAGIDMETMESIREAHHAYRHEHHAAIHEAVENNDYEAFKEAIEGSPMAEIIDSEEDFAQFVEAHNLREEGEKEAAREIMEELGFEGKMHGGKHGHRGMFGKHHAEDSES